MDTTEVLTNNILALDQSSRANGWAVFSNNKLIDYGVINLTDEDIGMRLVTLRNEIKKLITKYSINYVAFEDIQMQTSVGNNVKTFKVLANVFGIILELVTELNIKYTIVSSNTWKSALGIRGRKRIEQKQNAQVYVLNTYNIKAVQDTVDAICIGAHVCSLEEGFSWAE